MPLCQATAASPTTLDAEAIIGSMRPEAWGDVGCGGIYTKLSNSMMY